VAELSELLHPFLADDPRLDGTLYPDGDAIRFMDSLVPDGDPEVCEEYFGEFLDHLRAGHRRWSAHVAAHGADAAWTFKTGRPEVGVCLLHFETAPTTTPPRYESWEHYLASTTPAERRAMCVTRTKKANARRLMSEVPERRLTADDVWRMSRPPADAALTAAPCQPEPVGDHGGSGRETQQVRRSSRALASEPAECLELAGLIAAGRVAGASWPSPGAGSSGFHVADELVFQSVPGSVRGSPNRGSTLAAKPVRAVIRSPAIVTTSSP